MALLAVTQGERQLGYQLQETYGGRAFFSKWDFWSEPDPSHGSVKYVDRETAEAEGLVVAKDDAAYISVDVVTTAKSGRYSVRLESKATYNSGLFIIDVAHVPTGPGTWPAFWMYGSDASHPWPTWGEYDVIEATHADKRVLTTVHTGPGCAQEQVVAGVDFSGGWDEAPSGKSATNCDVNAEGQWQNQGCSQHGPDGTVGHEFNARGGGTFAADWDPEAGSIRAWFWPAGSVPVDVSNRRPKPHSWGRPYSYFSLNSGTCNANHFQNMRLVLNLNLCGDLGNAVFNTSCPQEAKTMTCQEVVSHPANMEHAFWSIRGIDVYKRAPQVPVSDLVFLTDGNIPQVRRFAPAAIGRPPWLGRPSSQAEQQSETLPEAPEAPGLQAEQHLVQPEPTAQRGRRVAVVAVALRGSIVVLGVLLLGGLCALALWAMFAGPRRRAETASDMEGGWLQAGPTPRSAVEVGEGAPLVVGGDRAMAKDRFTNRGNGQRWPAGGRPVAQGPRSSPRRTPRSSRSTVIARL